MLCVVLEKWENDNKECNNQPKYRGRVAVAALKIGGK